MNVTVAVRGLPDVRPVVMSSGMWPRSNVVSMATGTDAGRARETIVADLRWPSLGLWVTFFVPGVCSEAPR